VLAALVVAAAAVLAVTLTEQQEQQIQAAAAVVLAAITQPAAAVAVPVEVALFGFVTRAQPLDRSLRARTASTLRLRPVVLPSIPSLNPETW
jgi:hypothetical protein